MDADESVAENLPCDIINYNAKFPSESVVFKSIDYFTEVEKELREFSKIFVKLDATDKLNTSPVHLKYANALASFKFSHSQPRRELVEALKANNMASIFNSELKTFVHRSKYSTKDTYRFRRKYSSHQFTPSAIDFQKAALMPTSEKKCFDHVTIVKVYVPYPDKTRRENIKLQQEIVIGGGQSLWDLAQAIHCPMDILNLEDASKKSNLVPETPDEFTERNKQLFPSVMFFINNTFYTHGPDDISSNAREFLKNSNAVIPPSSSCNERLCNVPLQIGRPYLYQHGAQCEHVLMISNMRILAGKPRLTCRMPAVIAVNNAHPRTCSLCESRYVRWVVTDFQKYVYNPAFFCHLCFKSYCYKDGEKICPFSAYQYVESFALD